MEPGAFQTENLPYPLETRHLQVEVRKTSTNQLLGYVLLSKPASSDRRAAPEKPIGFVDGDGDGLVSASELDASVAGLQEAASAIAWLSPSAAASLAESTTYAKSLIKKGSIVEAYQQIVNVTLPPWDA